MKSTRKPSDLSLTSKYLASRVCKIQENYSKNGGIKNSSACTRCHNRLMMDSLFCTTCGLRIEENPAIDDSISLANLVEGRKKPKETKYLTEDDRTIQSELTLKTTKSSNVLKILKEKKINNYYDKKWKKDLNTVFLDIEPDIKYNISEFLSNQSGEAWEKEQYDLFNNELRGIELELQLAEEVEKGYDELYSTGAVYIPDKTKTPILSQGGFNSRNNGYKGKELVDILSVPTSYYSTFHNSNSNVKNIENLKSNKKKFVAKKKSDINVNINEYLNEVGSVDTYYKQLMEREKDLQGLTSSSMLDEILEVPSVIEERTNTSPIKSENGQPICGAWSWNTIGGNKALSSMNIQKIENDNELIIEYEHDNNVIANKQRSMSSFAFSDGDNEEDKELFRKKEIESPARGGSIAVLWTDFVLNNREEDYDDKFKIADEEAQEALTLASSKKTKTYSINPSTGEEESDSEDEEESDYEHYNNASNYDSATINTMQSDISTKVSRGYNNILSTLAYNSEEDSSIASLMNNEIKEYSVIARNYKNSIAEMKEAMNIAFHSYVKDPVAGKSHTLHKLASHYKILENSILLAQNCENECRLEFSSFQMRSSDSRTFAALNVAKLLKKTAHENSVFQTRYNKAATDFETHQLRIKGNSTVVSQILSNDNMDRILTEANKVMVELGKELQCRQADEMDLINSLTEQEEVIINIIQNWRPRHIEIVHKTRFVCHRINEILRNTAARIIQRNARQKFLIYYRQDVFDEWDIIDRRKRAYKRNKEYNVQQINDENQRFAEKKTPLSYVLKLPHLKSKAFAKPSKLLHALNVHTKKK